MPKYDCNAEVRMVTRGDENHPDSLILYPTESRQEKHLVSFDSRDVKARQYVIAQPCRKLDRCTIYHCDPIPDDRMVARCILTPDMAVTFIRWQGKTQRYWGAHQEGVERYAESVTHHCFDTVVYPYITGHEEWLIFVEEGSERFVLELLAKHLDDTQVIEFCPCGHVFQWTTEQMREHGMDPRLRHFPELRLPAVPG